MSPDSVTPQAPPRRRRPSKQLVCISENERNVEVLTPKSAPIEKAYFEYSVNEHAKLRETFSDAACRTPTDNPAPDLNLIPPTPATIRKEVDSEDTVGCVSKPSNLKVGQLKAHGPKKMLAVRTSSLPIVPVPQEILDEALEKSKSQSHENFRMSQTDPCLVTDLEKPAQTNATESDTDSRPQTHTHHKHKYSIKSFKKRLKHGGKRREKSAERNHKHLDTSDNDQALDTEESHDDVASHGSRSENDDGVLTDEDCVNQSEENAFHNDATKKEGFFRKFSVKVKMLVGKHDEETENDQDHRHKHGKRHERYVMVNDMSDDNEGKIGVMMKKTVREMTHSPSHGRLSDPLSTHPCRGRYRE